MAQSNDGGQLVCGVDEAGRGPLAGPVTAAAVLLPEDFPMEILHDSKVMTERQRHAAESTIRAGALAYAVGWAWPEEIDRINILQASMLAMKRAVEQLRIVPEIVLVDGNFFPELPYPCRAIIRGDSLVPQIMAASILAKTSRDRWMIDYAGREPQYRFEKHKGYPTKEHRALIGLYGPSKIQRLSFRFEVPASR